MVRRPSSRLGSRTLLLTITLLVVVVVSLAGGLSLTASITSLKPDLILVLAGGVDRQGRPHCTVAERLRAAANASKAHGGRPILLNGGGTTWKPRYVDRNGFSIPEAALMSQQIADEGIADGLLYPESFSDDTIGNAFFARTMHTDLRPEWRNLLVITSAFQMARTKAIYSWVFGLQPLTSRSYRLQFESVADDCLDPKVLALRRAKETTSLHNFENGPLVRMRSLGELHEFIYHQHGGYSSRGVTSKKALDSKLADTY